MQYLKRVDSTNVYALDLVSKTRPVEGTVISAWQQTAGRGQIGRSWHGEAGQNLTFSIILYPACPVSQQFYLSKAIAIGVQQYLEIYCREKVSIKWPNDICIGQKKIAGILIQTGIKGTQVQYAVVGIGLNVNQKVFPDTLANATSLCIEVGHQFDLKEALKSLLKPLDSMYAAFRRKEFEIIDEKYHRVLFRKGVPSLFSIPGEIAPFTAVIESVDAEGKIHLRRNTGKREAFGMREIVMHTD